MGVVPLLLLPILSYFFIKMKIIISFVILSLAMVAFSANVPNYPDQPVYGQLGCCRSAPGEYGSCRSNADCGQRTAPYCSGFGFCTQTQIYGINGCQDCAKPSHGKK